MIFSFLIGFFLFDFVLSGDPIDICVNEITIGEQLIDAKSAAWDARLFVIAKNGNFYALSDEQSNLTLLRTIDVQNSGESGLLALALHPLQRIAFFYYIDADGDSVLSQWSVAVNGQISNERELLRVQQPFANHQGAFLAISSVDGKLYLGLGDGGSANDRAQVAQNPNSLLGKILRIDVDGGAPSVEIFASGLRNPFACHFSASEPHLLYVADVGQNAYEEITVLDTRSAAPLNLGWPILEGLRCNTGAFGVQVDSQVCAAQEAVSVAPIFQYRNRGGTSVIGGVVMRSQLDARLSNRYIFSDYRRCIEWDDASREYSSYNCATPNLMVLDSDVGAADAQQEFAWVHQVRTHVTSRSRHAWQGQTWRFSVDQDGETLIVNSQAIFKIVALNQCDGFTSPPPPPPPPATAPPASSCSSFTTCEQCHSGVCSWCNRFDGAVGQGVCQASIFCQAPNSQLTRVGRCPVVEQTEQTTSAAPTAVPTAPPTLRPTALPTPAPTFAPVASTMVAEFGIQDFTLSNRFNALLDFQFAITFVDAIFPGARFENPRLAHIVYNVFGNLTEPTPSGFPLFNLQRAIEGDEFYAQGSSLSFAIAADADLSDGLQASELSESFVLNGREVNTGRYHPALMVLHANGTGSLQNSNNFGASKPNPGTMELVDVNFGAEYIIDLSFPPTLNLSESVDEAPSCSLCQRGFGFVGTSMWCNCCANNCANARLTCIADNKFCEKTGAGKCVFDQQRTKEWCGFEAIQMTTTQKVIETTQEETTTQKVIETTQEETTTKELIATTQEETTTKVETTTQAETTTIAQPTTKVETTTIAQPTTTETTTETTSTLKPSTTSTTSTTSSTSSTIETTTLPTTLSRSTTTTTAETTRVEPQPTTTKQSSSTKITTKTNQATTLDSTNGSRDVSIDASNNVSMDDSKDIPIVPIVLASVFVPITIVLLIAAKKMQKK